MKGSVTDKVVGSPSYLYLNVEIILDSPPMPIKHGHKNKHTSSHKLYGLPDRCAKTKKDMPIGENLCAQKQLKGERGVTRKTILFLEDRLRNAPSTGLVPRWRAECC